MTQLKTLQMVKLVGMQNNMKHSIEHKCMACAGTGIINKDSDVPEPCPSCPLGEKLVAKTLNNEPISPELQKKVDEMWKKSKYGKLEEVEENKCTCGNHCGCHHPVDCECHNHCYFDGCKCLCHKPLEPNPDWEEELKEKWSNSSGITTIDFIIREVKLQIEKAKAESSIKYWNYGYEKGKEEEYLNGFKKGADFQRENDL